MRNWLSLLGFIIFWMPAKAQLLDFAIADTCGKWVIQAFKEGRYADIARQRDTLFLPQHTAGTYEADWNELTGTYGQLDTFRPVFFSSINGYSYITYNLKFESLAYLLNMGFTPEKKLQTITFIEAHKTYVAPEYVNISKFGERNITIVNGMYELPGTFTYPYQGDKKPLVVIVPEAGPTDRDGSYDQNRPYRDIAGALSSVGYATYRYEKRPNIYNMFILRDKAAYMPYTCRDEYLDDLYKALDTLKTLPDVDPERIYILGHGQGGMLLPLVAKERPEVRGIIMMAANAKRTQEMMMDQYDYLAKVSPARTEEFMEQKAKAKYSMNKKLNPLTEHSKMPYEVQATYWIWLNNYHHMDIAKKLKNPMLLLHGDRDYQVNMENLELWKKNLGKKPNVTIKNYPKLNHLFYSGGAESTYPEYFMIGNIPDYVMTDIINWLSTH